MGDEKARLGLSFIYQAPASLAGLFNFFMKIWLSFINSNIWFII